MTFRLILGMCMTLLGCSFADRQRTHDRVANAYAEKEVLLTRKLREKGISWDSLEVLFVACKAEKILEVWVKPVGQTSYREHFSYEICAASGGPGPKMAQGDRQVPEGYYHIDRFNPASSFHLSLGINYPNATDLARTTATDPGGDIFIHGGCVSVGCLAMTDDQIREIYLLALQARKSGQDLIPVYLFPFRMTGENLQAALNVHPEHRDFWQNLQQGYIRFVNTRQVLTVQEGRNGRYQYL